MYIRQYLEYLLVLYRNLTSRVLEMLLRVTANPSFTLDFSILKPDLDAAELLLASISSTKLSFFVPLA